MQEHIQLETNSKLPIIKNIIIVILILGFAILLASYFIKNPAITKKEEKIETTKVFVNTKPIKLKNHTIKIEVMGKIIPAKEAILKSRLFGEIINVSDEFIPAGSFKKGEEILQIDPSDYEIDVKIKNAAFLQANAALELEIGQQKIAKDELKIIQKTTGRKLKNNDLALRKPQLEQAKANLAAAKAALDLTKLNLTRTKIIAPFNAFITERNVNLGNIISSQDILAKLVSTDEYWVDVELPINEIKWLKFPTNNKNNEENTERSHAIINLDYDRGSRKATLLKLKGSINSKSHLAEIILSIKDPLSLKEEIITNENPVLILGDYVNVTVIGKTLENIATIPKEYIRDNNSIWIEKNGHLIIQKITIKYQDRGFAYISHGIKDGDNIVTSNIITPINDMEITVQEN